MNKDTLYSYWAWNSKTDLEWWTPFWLCLVLPAFFLNCLLCVCPTPHHGISVILVLTCQPRGLKLLNPLQRSHLTCSQLQSPCKVPAAVTKQYSTPPICTLVGLSWTNYPPTHTTHTHTHIHFSHLLAKAMVDSGRQIMDKLSPNPHHTQTHTHTHFSHLLAKARLIRAGRSQILLWFHQKNSCKFTCKIHVNVLSAL